ncbi:sorting nexin-30-like isoform X4 [Hydractinia symbiolongicarpus]|uniref:sorting nexin-30-like isoform X4 n=1 Tax=Hydractinia symbiolongicarpus TaxID=13093 RepID=UPI00254B02E3|nr:sorting nexin-30-like isoform X4 [Hydractinia symbiolongicarpus]
MDDENLQVAVKKVSIAKKIRKAISFENAEAFFKILEAENGVIRRTMSWINLRKKTSGNLDSERKCHSHREGMRRRSVSVTDSESDFQFEFSGLMPVPSSCPQTRRCTSLREQAKQENSLMVLKLARTEQQLHEALEKNKLLNQRLVEKGEHLEDAKRQIDVLNAKLDREMQCSSELYHKVKDLELLLENFKTGAPPVVTDDNDNELLFNSSTFDESLEQLEEHLKRSSTPIGDLMLSCTLCNERIRIEELESHSSKCSADSARKVKNGKEIKPSPQPMLVATVTCARRESMQANIDTDCPFKVICKTTIPEFKKTLLTCERTKEDFEWFRKALEEFHPERVIPPLTFHCDLTVNLREIQRFLSRICSHKMLKGDPLVRKFFTATHKELEKFKKSFHKKIPKYLKHQKPAIEVVDKDGILFKTQIYIAQLIENLLSLTEFFKTNNDKTIDSLSKCFLQLSAGETNETYLMTVANGLSGIIAELENKKNVIYDESVLAEDLESILEFVKSADELLYRVECSVNTFLYWEEEIRVFEEMKSEGLVTSTNGKDITQLWAEASSNCRTAKDELEYMCRQLSEELSEFDIRKEQELKQIFIEYAESRCDVFEKMQSKWFGVKLMLNTDIVPGMRAVDFKK